MEMPAPASYKAFGADAPPVAAEAESSKVMRGIKGIIFDFDGTLFDNALIPFYLIAAHPLDILRVWRERLVRRRFAGCDYSSADYYYRAFFAAMGKLCLRSPERMQGWYFNQFMPRMVRVLKKHYRLRPGVQELFRRFDGSKTLKVAVYSDYPFLRERLEALGLYPGPWIALYGPETFGAQKPAARPFLSIAGAFGLAPEEILVVGDRDETDGLGAFNAGMRYFCLETGRKRYARLDPYHRRGAEEPRGPSLVMYSGIWEDLAKALMNF